MDLSEAMLLGAMLSKQCFGRLTYSKRGPDGEVSVIRACALGSALHAAGAVSRRNPARYFQVLNHVVHGPCECPNYYYGYTVESAVIHLNDTHKWTRERIAAWVRTVELTLATPAEPVEDDATVERELEREMESELELELCTKT